MTPAPTWWHQLREARSDAVSAHGMDPRPKRIRFSVCVRVLYPKGKGRADRPLALAKIEKDAQSLRMSFRIVLSSQAKLPKHVGIGMR